MKYASPPVSKAMCASCQPPGRASGRWDRRWSKPSSTRARVAAVEQSRAACDQTVAVYRQTVVSAFQQVEDNLASVAVLARVLEQQHESVLAAARALDVATARYRAGLDPYLNVVVARIALLAAQQSELGFATQRRVATVNLIEALGGGWDRTAKRNHRG